MIDAQDCLQMRGLSNQGHCVLWGGEGRGGTGRGVLGVKALISRRRSA
jgi:hypothetical protein